MYICLVFAKEDILELPLTVIVNILPILTAYAKVFGKASLYAVGINKE